MAGPTSPSGENLTLGLHEGTSRKGGKPTFLHLFGARPGEVSRSNFEFLTRDRMLRA